MIIIIIIIIIILLTFNYFSNFVKFYYKLEYLFDEWDENNRWYRTHNK